jgi:hypothetical protein
MTNPMANGIGAKLEYWKRQHQLVGRVRGMQAKYSTKHHDCIHQVPKGNSDEELGENLKSTKTKRKQESGRKSWNK